MAGLREAGAASGRRWWQGAAQALDRRQQDGQQGLLEEKGIGAAIRRCSAIGVFGVHGDDNDLGLGALYLDPVKLKWVGAERGA